MVVYVMKGASQPSSCSCPRLQVVIPLFYDHNPLTGSSRILTALTMATAASGPISQTINSKPVTLVSDLTIGQENHEIISQRPSPLKKDANQVIDIEHVHVEDDPRQWSNARKNAVLCIVAGASMIAGLSANIQNPSNEEIEKQLHASASEISLSVSLFILIQGNAPYIWSAISEIKGRKMVYIVSIALFTVGSAIVAISKSIGLLIGMRCLQAAGSSAVMAIGAATLADIYDPKERGSKMGLYYAAPMLGPSLGPILGGVLTDAFSWRASFWFLVIFGGIIFSSFLLLFKDTFRRERSMVYQGVLKKRQRERARDLAKSETSTMVEGINRGNDDGIKRHENPSCHEGEKHATPDTDVNSGMREIKLSLLDVNPFKPVGLILRRWNNLAILVASGILFAMNFCISYTCARTLSIKYGYNSLFTGLTLLSFGIGAIVGSMVGGRWSDYILAKTVARNNGISIPEMRLKSTIHGIPILPLSLIGYGWVCQYHVHVAAVCVFLFFAGFGGLFVYASTLAYIVDANVGRSGTAVATNSSFRGILAFVAAEVAVPLQDAIGDGGLYTLWAGLVVIAELLLILVLLKGGDWREHAVLREERKMGSRH